MRVKQVDVFCDHIPGVSFYISPNIDERPNRGAPLEWDERAVEPTAISRTVATLSKTDYKPLLNNSHHKWMSSTQSTHLPLL